MLFYFSFVPKGYLLGNQSMVGLFLLKSAAFEIQITLNALISNT
jgi:hypothetical protein